MSLMNFFKPSKQPNYKELFKRLSYEEHIEQTLRDLTGTVLDKTDKEALQLEHEVYSLRCHERYGRIADYVWRRWYSEEVKFMPMKIIQRKKRNQFKPSTQIHRFPTAPKLRVILGRRIIQDKKRANKNNTNILNSKESVKDSMLKSINNLLYLLNKM